MDKSVYLGSVENPKPFNNNDPVINMVCRHCNSVTPLNLEQATRIFEFLEAPMPDDLSKKYLLTSVCQNCEESQPEARLDFELMDLN